MSLEQALADNTAAIKELIAQLKTAPVAKAEKPAKKEVETAPAAVAPATTPATSDKFDEVKNLTLELSKSKNGAGRDEAVAILAKFGVTKAPQLKAEQYDDYIAAVKAALTDEALV